MRESSRTGGMGLLRLGLLAVVILPTAASTGSAWAFGGEDVYAGGPWHHLDMTLRALAGDANARVQPVSGPGGLRRPKPAQVFTGVGFTREAAMDVAWHADYIDSYIYNPVWWLKGNGSWTQGGVRRPGNALGRVQAALRTTEDLIKLHHDDSASTAAVKDNWDRYYYGTLIGLRWAMEKNDVQSARHLLGVSSHAVQDFYTHSNWLDDPARRGRTWQEVPSTERDAMQLHTGAYEHPVAHTRVHHGAYAADCTVLNQALSNRLLTGVCSAASPFHGLHVCDQKRMCASGRKVELRIGDRSTGKRVVQSPPGLNVDSTLFAPLGGTYRGVLGPGGSTYKRPHTRAFDGAEGYCRSVINLGVECDHTASGEPCALATKPRLDACTAASDDLFAESKLTAGRSTTQWVWMLGESVKTWPGGTAFWDKVRGRTPSGGSRAPQALTAARTQPFEDPAKAPFQFLSAGPYPVASPGSGHAHAYGKYLRVTLKTGGDVGAGTDADIVAHIRHGNQTSARILDLLPIRDNASRTQLPGLVHNDFERGSVATYALGPFKDWPTSLELENRAASSGDVVRAAISDFKQGLSRALTSIRRALLKPIGGNPDWVGDGKELLTAEALEAGTARGPMKTSITAKGGPEGIYRVDVTITRRPGGYSFVVDRLHCVKESAMDRFSNSDEPFFFLIFSPIRDRATTPTGYWGGPYDDVDSGESRAAKGKRDFPIDLSDGEAVALSLRVYDHDSDNEHDRRELWDTFRTGVAAHVREEAPRLLHTLGASIDPDWQLASIEVYGFDRDRSPEAGFMLSERRDRWVRGGTRQRFALSRSRVKPVSSVRLGDVRSRLPAGNTPYIVKADLGSLTARGSSGGGTSLVVRRADQGTVLGGRVASDAGARVVAAMQPWRGSWQTTFGELRLIHDGNRVHGDYANIGRIEGTYDASTGRLVGTFTNGGRTGHLSFVLKGGAFEGTWGWSKSTMTRSWTGTQSSKSTPTLRN